MYKNGRFNPHLRNSTYQFYPLVRSHDESNLKESAPIRVYNALCARHLRDW